MSKLDKLSELSELLKLGAISKEEFDVLKKEIIDGKTANSSSTMNEKTNPPQTEEKTTKKTNDYAFEKSIYKQDEEDKDKIKIYLKSFEGEDTKRIQPPKIEYLNINKINAEELKLLKPFIKEKLIYAPTEMTNDEIKISNKIFSASEVNKIISDRAGFNFPLLAIGGLLSGGLAIVLVKISPCMMFLGGTTAAVNALIMAGYCISREAATKLDKSFAYITLVEIAITYIVYSHTVW